MRFFLRVPWLSSSDPLAQSILLSTAPRLILRVQLAIPNGRDLDIAAGHSSREYQEHRRALAPIRAGRPEQRSAGTLGLFTFN
jgi:hypothetical protein